jgi:membrane protein implicated in regulation of membrane protease activity
MNLKSDLKYSYHRNRVLIRYALLQLPSIAVLILVLIVLRSYIDLPGYAFWGTVFLWILKDILLYPIVGRYYNPDYRKDRFSMVGMTGIAQEPLAPNGYVRVRGELWKAKVIDKDIIINAGENVIIRGMDGLTLIVEHNRPMLKLVEDSKDRKSGGA